MIKGYKCFNEDFTNRYGIKFEVGRTYEIKGNTKFGNKGLGYHFCKNFEDTFRYFDTRKQNILLCEVISLTEVVEYYDDYNEYYDMYATNILKIEKLLNRKEIIELTESLTEDRILRFIRDYRLTKEEIEYFYERYCDKKSIKAKLDYYYNNQPLKLEKK